MAIIMSLQEGELFPELSIEDQVNEIEDYIDVWESFGPKENKIVWVAINAIRFWTLIKEKCLKNNYIPEVVNDHSDTWCYFWNKKSTNDSLSFNFSKENRRLVIIITPKGLGWNHWIEKEEGNTTISYQLPLSCKDGSMRYAPEILCEPILQVSYFFWNLEE